MLTFLNRHQLLIARIAMGAIFLALIRCIGECFRLHYLATSEVCFAQLMPFLLGAMVAAVACMGMVILSFFSQSKIITVVAVLTVVSLLAIKAAYL